jgi:plasmid maintenance system killer protein
LEIRYKSDKLKNELTNQKEMVRRHGKRGSDRLRQRLYDLSAASNLEEMRNVPGRCHELTGDRLYQLAMNVDGGKRLIFEVADEPLPLKPDRGLDWSAVTIVQILEVKDYH